MSKRAFASRAAESPGPGYGASRPLQVAEDIIPIAELKARFGEVVRGLDARRPLVVTLNGKAAAVIMSPREFDRLTYERRFVEMIRERLDDAEAGNVLDGEQVFDELEAMADARVAASKPAPRRRKRR